NLLPPFSGLFGAGESKAPGAAVKAAVLGFSSLHRERASIFYFDDNANFNAIRWNDWKIHFGIAWEGWTGPREALNFPRIINLRSDPYEESLESGLYARFFGDQLWLFVPTQQEVGKWLMTFREFPPRQPTASFSIDQMMQQMQQMLQAQVRGG
ncbi:MAG: hypothetical protein O7F73_00350, partial [Gammaproteobacteria bacterium]|nr:hypothetical protein [Gammaproteobacteria bacterium]